MRIKMAFALIGLMSLVIPSPVATAVYDGRPATGSPLVLTLLTNKSIRTSFCSMSLLTERIVVTAAHCVIQDQGVAPNLRWDLSDIYVSQPGADVTKDDLNTRVRVLKVVTRDSFINTWKPEISDYRTQIDDIAFLFLEKPLVKGYKIEIANELEINTAISQGDVVTHFGYGLQAPGLQNHAPWTTQLPLINVTPAHLDKSKVMYTREWPSALCPGDSGGPWYIQVNGVTKIAAVLVAASGCRGNLPYNGGALGTRIYPYMEMAQSKWEEFIAEEKSFLAAKEEAAKTLEEARQLAITNGNYITPGGCHAPGIQAEVQSLSKDGTWQFHAATRGWIPSSSSCPQTHSVQPWAVVSAENGTKLRWRFFASTFEVFGDVVNWSNPPPKQTSESPVKTTPKLRTIICSKGKLLKKILGVNPKCPNGWNLKKN